jgi:exodeoxyribonuclease VII large subunit
MWLNTFSKSNEEVYSVREINEALKKITATFFPSLWVEGEISSIRFHNTGNVYLTIKDDHAVLDAVIFRNALLPEYRNLKEGDHIVVRGGISVYVKGGKYSFNIREIKAKGKGAIYEKFLQLKEKLEKEGLFDSRFKKEIPFLPSRIGIVTSPDGAAVRDILKVTRNRFPSVDILVFPAKVQGEGGAETVIAAIKAANRMVNELDVLIVGRGGGSYDELSLFNDENLAYAIFESKVPVISAVGHERDFTIADFVADQRAATPSHAAEMAVPSREELLQQSGQYANRLMRYLENKLRYSASLLSQYDTAYLSRLMEDRVNHYYRELDDYHDGMNRFLEKMVDKKKNELELFYHSLEKLNPLYLLKKNYAVVYDEEGKNVIGSIKQAENGDLIRVRLKDGFLGGTVQEKIPLKD